MYNDVQFRGYGALVMITDLGPEEKRGGGGRPFASGESVGHHSQRVVPNHQM